MSLAKLPTRLREHDWTAAVIELLIVVAGILIALQVSNWNEDRHDSARADSYYRRLHASLVADQKSMDSTLAFWRQVSAYGREAMDYSESGKRVDDSNWKTVLAYYQASQLMPFEMEDTTFLEMRDTGVLTLIKDEALRNRIAEYYRTTSVGSIRANILRHDPEYRRQIRGLTPWPVQEYIWAKCYRQLGGTEQELIDCPSPISDEAAAALLEVFRENDSLLANLRYWVSTLRVSEIVVTDSHRTVEALARDVQAARVQ
jgi:hypothetical protein